MVLPRNMIGSTPLWPTHCSTAGYCITILIKIEGDMLYNSSHFDISL